MRIFLPIIKIIVNYTLRITNRYCIQINKKTAPHKRSCIYIPYIHASTAL